MILENIIENNILKIRKLNESDEPSFRAAVAEFKKVDPTWDFAFHFDEQANFSDYVKRLERWAMVGEKRYCCCFN